MAQLLNSSTRRTTLVDRGSVQLATTLTLPAGEPPFPCVVFVHGLGSSKESPRNVVVAERLVDFGIATVLFDLSGHGESGTDPRGREDAYVKDLEAVFAWTAAQPEIDSEHLGVAGSSLGAVVALDAARQRLISPRALVLRAPPVEREHLADLAVPALVIIGTRDPLQLEVEQAAHMIDAVAISSVEGAGHLFEEPGTLEIAVELTVEWFRARLKDEGERVPEWRAG